MLKRIDLKQNNISAISSALSAASIANVDVEQTVRTIINDVKVRGDDALCHYAEKFDGFIPEIFWSVMPKLMKLIRAVKQI